MPDIIQIYSMLCNVGDILTYISLVINYLSSVLSSLPLISFTSQCGIIRRTGFHSQLLSNRFSLKSPKLTSAFSARHSPNVGATRSIRDGREFCCVTPNS